MYFQVDPFLRDLTSYRSVHDNPMSYDPLMNSRHFIVNSSMINGYNNIALYESRIHFVGGSSRKEQYAEYLQYSD